MSEQNAAVEKKCPKCSGRMVPSNIWDNNGFSVKPEGTGFFTRTSGTAAFVCRECGYIELYAKRLDVFRKD